MLHYLEIVCENVEAHCALLEQTHSFTFGNQNPDLGQARVTEAPDGSLIGIRKPLAEHETPTVRSYLKVDDMEKAIKNAENAGATIAYPPTQQGNTGTWAIYILGGIQYGLWST